jgi:tight adherence protein B
VIIELVLLIGAIVATGVLFWLSLGPWRQERAERERLGRLIGRDEDERDIPPEDVPSRFRRNLLAAGIPQHPLIAVAVILAIAAIFAIAMAAMFNGNLWAAGIAGLLAIGLMLTLITEFGRRRLMRFETLFVDWIDLAAGTLSSGQEPIEAFAYAAESAEQPVRREVEDLVSKLNSSVPIEIAVRNLTTNWDCEAVRLFSQLLVAKWELGGQLGPALRDVSRTVRNALRLRRQLQASLGSAQISAIVVGLIPYAVMVGFLRWRPEVLPRLWATSWGIPAFVAAILLQFFGLLWIRRLMRSEL